jgi:tRNA(Arg) A34 adenosine deaminase TadA
MTLEIPLPRWFEAWAATLPARLDDDAAAMAVALEACRRNLDNGTGGPFGAALIEEETRRLLGIGVNLVVSGRASVLHAEIVALTLAQQRAGTDNLAAGGRSVTLYATAEPCAMCLGAIPWSGVNRVVCGARDADVRAVGFDEGDKPVRWVEKFRRRGIAVTRDVRRAEAVGLLARYAAEGGVQYGPHG